MDLQPIQPDKWMKSRTEIIGGNIGLNFFTCEHSLNRQQFVEMLSFDSKIS